MLHERQNAQPSHGPTSHGPTSGGPVSGGSIPGGPASGGSALDEPLEHELRVLLERGTPRLATSDGLLRQVRERVVRRRRIRMALVTGGAAAVALATAGALLLPTTADSRRPALSARTPAAVAPTEDTVTFTELDGLTVRLPRAWHTLTMPADRRNLVEPQGFIATQPVAPFNRPCQMKYADGCLPLDRLGRGDILITVTAGGPPRGKIDGRASRKLRAMGVDDNCAAIGGAVTHAASLVTDSKPYPAVLSAFRVCAAAGTTAETWADVQKMIDSAQLDDADTSDTTTPTGR
ncbi:hypothetical protein [Streptomyces sp. NPDC059076]|uniref:hypothetical protein n=1 Tax=unclassified Streptomyces TaxID=2593676 RepID=UPI003698E07E